jgi:uncharacterized membrane protein YkvA (DUF1232 family)
MIRMPFDRTAFWPRDDIDLAGLRRAFWRKLGASVARIPFAEDLLAAYYCAFDRDTPLHVKGALVGAIVYFVLPADATPDFLPVIGFIDDGAVLAATLKLVADYIRPLHRAAAKDALNKLGGEAGS